MLGRKILFVGGVLLICSLARCHHLSVGDEDYSNKRAWEVARDRGQQRSGSQRVLRDEQSGDDDRRNGDSEIVAHLEGEDSLRRQWDRNEVDPEDFRKFLPRGGGAREGEASSEETSRSHPRFHGRRDQRDSHHKRGHPIDQMSQGIDPEVRREEGEALERRDPRESQEGQSPTIGGDESTSEEEEEEEPPTSKSESRESRIEGYEQYEGLGVYKFHRQSAAGFDEANEICKMEGGHLAIANSKDEADVLVTLWTRHGPAIENDAYVGIHNRNPQNVFRTVLGNSLASTGYLAWRAGEPDNHNGVEQCVSFFRYGGYRDVPCDGPRPFICELRWKNEN